MTCRHILCWLYEPLKHKTKHRGKRRRIWIGPAAQQLLAPILAVTAPEAYLFPPPKRHGVRRRDHGYYPVCSYARSISYAVKKANVERAEKGLPQLEKWSPNQLRHARLTEVGKSSLGPLAAQACASHSSFSATSVYLHMSDELAKAAAKL